jgi:hypothetical protein
MPTPPARPAAPDSPAAIFNRLMGLPTPPAQSAAPANPAPPPAHPEPVAPPVPPDPVKISPPPEATVPAGLAPPELITSSLLLSRLIRPSDLHALAPNAIPWLWQGYLAPGKVTLLTSQWKCGKTTLVSVLLSRMQHGGQLAGLSVAPGRAVVVSEESPDDWKRRCRRFAFGDHIDFLCRPFKARPTMTEWLALIDALGQLRTRKGTDLAVIDPLSAFLPGHAENVPALMLEALLPFQRLTDAGLALFLPHHPTKGKVQPGQAARGTGVLPSFADIVIEKTFHGHPASPDRRRRLWGFSRLPETPRRLLIELNAAETDYLVHTDAPDELLPDGSQAILFVLEDAVEKLTRQEILEQWPSDFVKPDQATVWRCLQRAVADGRVRQEGTGRKTDPFRYWLPSREELMNPGPMATQEELQAWNLRVLHDRRPAIFAQPDAHT